MELHRSIHYVSVYRRKHMDVLHLYGERGRKQEDTDIIEGARQIE